MRIVFMGSASFSCPALAALQSSRDDAVVAVVTQPDRKKGRQLRTVASPVKVQATAAGIPVLTPEGVNARASVAGLAAFAPDLFVVVAYGQILKPALLALPHRGCINVHASLLPKYRGAAPIQWSIVNGERVTGVTVMHMAEHMDAGDILLQKERPIGQEETAGALHDVLATMAATALLEALPGLRDGSASRVPQDDAAATFAPKLTKECGRMDWTKSAKRLYDEIRGFNPWPCSFCEVPLPDGRSERLRVLAGRVEASTGVASSGPGTIIEVGPDGPLVRTGDDRCIRLVSVQPAGKRVMSGGDFTRGRCLAAGVVLV